MKTLALIFLFLSCAALEGAELPKAPTYYIFVPCVCAEGCPCYDNDFSTTPITSGIEPNVIPEYEKRDGYLEPYPPKPAISWTYCVEDDTHSVQITEHGIIVQPFRCKTELIGFSNGDVKWRKK